MITKSKLHEIEKLWMKLDREKTSISKVKLVKEIISLLDTEDYFEETADFLNTTTLKLRHLTVLSLMKDEEFVILLELAGGNLDLCYLFNLFPENELKAFIKTYKNISSVEKLVYFAANKLDSMHLDSKAEKEIPWISNIKELEEFNEKRSPKGGYFDFFKSNFYVRNEQKTYNYYLNKENYINELYEKISNSDHDNLIISDAGLLDPFGSPGISNIFLIKEIKNQNNNQYYLSGTNVSTRHGLINFDCGSTYFDFDEKKVHNFCLHDETPDLQSSHWAPHLIHKELWDKIGGFSEEFNPGDGSDPDFCMKLWKQNVRIFKGVSKFKVYHFNSLTTRNDKIILNNGTRTFLSKYGFNPKFFRKHYLRGNNSVIPFKGRLNNPKKNFSMLLDLSINKIKYTINKFRA